MADTENHCIRKIVLKLKNVETVAGICGQPGNEDGVLTANRLNRPEVVGVDAQGYVFVWDEGNKAVRMLDLDGILHTMVDGACRRDLNMPRPDIPFEMDIRGMVCYRTWSKRIPQRDGNIDHFAMKQEVY